MATIADYPQRALFRLGDRLAELIQTSGCVQGAAQRCLHAIYAEFEESMVLARQFTTVRFGKLPETDREFAIRLADSHGISKLLGEDSIVLSLMGSCGARKEWNDRYRSRGHLAIPLVTADFADGIPMISKLLTDMGVGLDWLDQQETDIVVKAMGTMARVFYVKEAKSAVDGKGRKIVAAQDFVHANDLQTVFGLGGGYIDGTFTVMIFFTRELLERPQVEKFMLPFSRAKHALVDFVMEGKVFA